MTLLLCKSHFHFVWTNLRLQISARRLLNRAETVRVFSHLLQANARMVYRIVPQRLTFTFLLIPLHRSICHFEPCYLRFVNVGNKSYRNELKTKLHILPLLRNGLNKNKKPTKVIHFQSSFSEGGTRWCSWLRHYATSRKFAGSIPDGVIGIFHLHNPSGRVMALGST